MRSVRSVESQDGSVIGFETFGQGPPLVLVHGTSADRSRWHPVVARLSERYTVHVVDRRGRGLSTAEAHPYALAREGEDVAAVIEAVGREVYLVGHSYGALCSLEAAQITDAIGRMVLYEPPAATSGHYVVSHEILDRIRAITAAGDAERVLEVFFAEVVHAAQATIETMKKTPIWPARLAAAHTIVRELERVEVFDISERLSKIAIPVRLFLGTESPGYFEAAARAIVAKLPHADIFALPGQAHMMMDNDPEGFAAAVFEFAR